MKKKFISVLLTFAFLLSMIVPFSLTATAATTDLATLVSNAKALKASDYTYRSFDKFSKLLAMISDLAQPAADGKVQDILITNKYSVKNGNSLSLDSKGDMTDGSHAYLKPTDANNANQHWYQIKDPDGKHFKLLNKGTGLYLCLDDTTDLMSLNFFWNIGAYQRDITKIKKDSVALWAISSGSDADGYKITNKAWEDISQPSLLLTGTWWPWGPHDGDPAQTFRDPQLNGWDNGDGADVIFSLPSTPVDAASLASTLQAAIDSLQPSSTKVFDSTGLTAALTAAADTKFADSSIYTAESWKAFSDALNTAKKIDGDKNQTQNAVDDATLALTTATTKIIKITSMDKLKADIINASILEPSSYTPISFKILTDAITDAQTYVDNTKGSDADVNAKATNLENIMNGYWTKDSGGKDLFIKSALVKLADKSALQGAMVITGLFKQSDFDTVTWNSMQLALSVAKDVYNDPDVSQASVDDIQKSLVLSISGLKKAPAKSSSSTSTSSTGTKTQTGIKTTANTKTNTGASTENPHTGQGSSLPVALSILGISSGIIIFFNRKSFIRK